MMIIIQLRDKLTKMTPKISVKFKNKSPIKVSYVFFDQEEFLYDSVTYKLYTPLKPHKHVGNICPDTLQVLKLQSDILG